MASQKRENDGHFINNDLMLFQNTRVRIWLAAKNY